MNLTLIFALVSIIAQNQYCLHEQGCFRYSCGDFAKDAVILLRENNVSAYPICNGKHYWIWADGFQIEPQTASLIPSNEGIYVRGRHCVARGLW